MVPSQVSSRRLWAAVPRVPYLPRFTYLHARCDKNPSWQNPSGGTPLVSLPCTSVHFRTYSYPDAGEAGLLQMKNKKELSILQEAKHRSSDALWLVCLFADWTSTM